MVCGGLRWFACFSSFSPPIVPNCGGGLWWFAVVCGGLRWFAVVCGGLRWFVVVCGGLRWFVIVCGSLSYSHTLCKVLENMPPFAGNADDAARTAHRVRTCGTVLNTAVLGFSQCYYLVFLFITKAQAIESNAGLGHAWQKMCGIDAKPCSR